MRGRGAAAACANCCSMFNSVSLPANNTNNKTPLITQLDPNTSQRPTLSRNQKCDNNTAQKMCTPAKGVTIDCTQQNNKQITLYYFSFIVVVFYIVCLFMLFAFYSICFYIIYLFILFIFYIIYLYYLFVCIICLYYLFVYI